MKVDFYIFTTVICYSISCAVGGQCVTLQPTLMSKNLLIASPAIWHKIVLRIEDSTLLP